MDKFLELAFINHARNYDEIYIKVDELQQPIIEELDKLLSHDKSGELQEILSDCILEICHYVGVKGMELAIGVANGSIKQCIE